MSIGYNTNYSAPKRGRVVFVFIVTLTFHY
nr:MAG TPA: hypothetical protein [Caudoviricetes sp.]